MQDSVVRRTAGLVKGLVGGQVARTYKAEWDLLSEEAKDFYNAKREALVNGDYGRMSVSELRSAYEHDMAVIRCCYCKPFSL
jgi:hypothetical protein